MLHNSHPEKRIAVIGAGCSGITALKNLVQSKVGEVVCYEQNNQVGGNWIYSAAESHSSVCETTHIISSKKLSEYCDFAMPEHYPDYPSHEQLLVYFQDYATHFNLYPYIRFNTKVQRAEKIAHERWQLTLANGEVETFDYLVIANGHHSVPRMPELPGAFNGRVLHAHSYKTNTPFRNERVLVIGAGNSACDCAVEISRVASHVSLSVRSPQYIIPKFFLGKPTDTFNANMSWVPNVIAEPLRQLSLWLQIGRYTDYGLEQPDFATTKAHPTLNSELLYKIRHGKVHPRRGIQAIHGDVVTFTDGRAEVFDTILAATGYKIAFPFFAADFINYEDASHIPLYLRMFHPEHPSLIFIGLFQPQGAIWPLSDYQAQLASKYIAGSWNRPAEIAHLANQDAHSISKNFIPSKRHAIEVHYPELLRRLQKELKR